jgi:hypothetical protein
VPEGAEGILHHAVPLPEREKLPPRRRRSALGRKPAGTSKQNFCRYQRDASADSTRPDEPSPNVGGHIASRSDSGTEAALPGVALAEHGSRTHIR